MYVSKHPPLKTDDPNFNGKKGKRPKFRWGAGVRSFNGESTAWVEVTARFAHQAARKAQVACYERHKDERMPSGITMELDDWYVMYVVMLNPQDQHRINEILRRKFPIDRERKATQPVWSDDRAERKRQARRARAARRKAMRQGGTG